MSHALLLAIFGLAAAMLVSLYRLLKGPTVWDRLTGLSLIGTKTIVLILLLGARTDRPDDFVDITLAYTLVAYVGTLALAKYFELKQGDRA